MCGAKWRENGRRAKSREEDDTGGGRRGEWCFVGLLVLTVNQKGQQRTNDTIKDQKKDTQTSTNVAVGARRARDTRRALHTSLTIAPRHANRPHNPRCSGISRHAVAAHQARHPLQTRPPWKPCRPRHPNHSNLPQPPRWARRPPTPWRPWQACRALKAARAGHPDARCALGTGTAGRTHGPAGSTRSFLVAEPLQFARHAACFGCRRHERRRQLTAVNARMRRLAACRL